MENMEIGFGWSSPRHQKFHEQGRGVRGGTSDNGAIGPRFECPAMQGGVTVAKGSNRNRDGHTLCFAGFEGDSGKSFKVEGGAWPDRSGIADIALDDIGPHHVAPVGHIDRDRYRVPVALDASYSALESSIRQPVTEGVARLESLVRELGVAVPIAVFDALRGAVEERVMRRVARNGERQAARG